MTRDEAPTNETSPLLNDESAGQAGERKRQTIAISVDGISTTRIVVVIGFTWFGSFLAALGD